MIRLTPEQAFERAMAYKNSLQEVNTLNTSGMRKTRGLSTTPSVDEYDKNTINFKVDDDSESGNIYYFVNKEDGSGIITPAVNEEQEESSPFLPLLGNLDANNGSNGLPPGLVDWLKSYDDEINWVKENGVEEIVNENENENEEDIGGIDEEEDDTIIGPLIDCKWYQKSPYYNKMVFYNKTSSKNEYCLTGCGATAIAQILYYWGCQLHNNRYFRVGCKATTKYTSSTKIKRKKKGGEVETTYHNYEIKGLPNLPEFDYKNLIQRYEGWSAENAAAVSEMMLYCACAAGSTFSPYLTTSSQSRLKDVFAKYLGFYSEKLDILLLSNSPENFTNRIKDELRHGRPCLILGNNNGVDGHHFICDGYNPINNLYHFNWGWNGDYDGWLAMNALKSVAGKYNFNDNKRALVGINPIIPIKGDYNGDGYVTVTDITTAVAILNGQKVGGEIIDVDDPKVIEILDLNNDGKITIEDIQLMIRKALGNNYEG